MSFDYIRKLPTPDEIREQYPVPDSLVTIKQKRDAEIRDVLTGKSDKLLVIIGPCSADNEDAVCDYINRLAKVNDKVSEAAGEIIAILTAESCRTKHRFNLVEGV